MTTTTKDEKRGVKNLYKRCVLDGYKEIGVVTGDLKVTLGYITKYTIGDAEYQNNGFKPIPLRFFAEDLGISTKTASAHIHILEQMGFIKVDRGGKHEHDANRYSLTPEYMGLSKTTEITQDMTPEQQPAPVEDNIDWKGKYDALYEKAGAEWRKKSKECKELQARLDKANQWKKNLGTYEFIESAVAFFLAYQESGGQPVEKLQAENKQLKAENERLRKSIDASLQEETPQEQHDVELQKYKNSLEEATNKIKAKDARIGELENRLNNRDSERDKAFDKTLARAIKAEERVKELEDEMEQQKLVHEEKIEKLTESNRTKDGAIKILQNDLKKARTGESILVTEEPSTPYGGTVKKIQYS